MNVVIALDGRFALNEGVPASPHLHYEAMWTRYLEVFDSVTILGRLYPVSNPRALPVEGPKVTFVPIPGYNGALDFLRKRAGIARLVAEHLPRDAAYILKPPSLISTLAYQQLRRTGHPYAVEVVGDPYDVFAPGAVRHPLRPFFRYWFPRQLRLQCAGADAALYVTREALQRRYPPGPQAYAIGCSDVNVPPSAMVPAPRVFGAAPEVPRLVSVGNLAQLYKSPDVIIAALGQLRQEGLRLEMTFVGDGQYRAQLEQQAQQLGVGDSVHFAGQLPAGSAVIEQLDRADLFVLPSRQEGLPRAMVEAMARALPCVGSTVGGFPELLPAEDLVPPGDANALAAKLREVLTDPVRLAAMSARNLETARGYEREALQARRLTMYRHICEVTEAWLAAGGR